MEVAILYSGGKDSTLAIEYAISKGWKIKYLLSIKPNRTDCYLFHFATVEHTKQLSKILNYKHIYKTCNVADPKKEALIVKKVVEKNPVQYLLLGGTGLQVTQLKTLQETLMPLGIEVFATHAGLDHDGIMEDMINNGYEVIITQVASDGLGQGWLGKKLTRESFNLLKKLSIKYGFHVGFEGGYADTLVVDGPIFTKKLEISNQEIKMLDDYCGYLECNSRIVEKEIIK